MVLANSVKTAIPYGILAVLTLNQCPTDDRFCFQLAVDTVLGQESEFGPIQLISPGIEEVHSIAHNRSGTQGKLGTKAVLLVPFKGGSGGGRGMGGHCRPLRD